MNILIINGPNINLLGRREVTHYGHLTLDKITSIIETTFPTDQFTFLQSNSEGEIISAIQQAEEQFEGIVINPGGYSHTSVAIRDALEECKLPKIEVHLSHLVNREVFRQTLITASGCDGYISGFMEKSYLAAIFLLKSK